MAESDHTGKPRSMTFTATGVLNYLPDPRKGDKVWIAESRGSSGGVYLLGELERFDGKRVTVTISEVAEAATG